MWSTPHEMTVMHLSTKFGAYIYPIRSFFDIFAKLKMAAAAILDLQVK